MIYFFHHYELPAILQQARIQQIIIETQQNSTAAETGDNNANNNNNSDTDGSGGNSNINNQPESDNNPNTDNNEGSSSSSSSSSAVPGQPQDQHSHTHAQLNFKNDELSNSLLKLAFASETTTRMNNQERVTRVASHDSSFKFNLDIVLKKAIQTETNLNKRRTVTARRLTESIKVQSKNVNFNNNNNDGLGPGRAKPPENGPA